MYGNDSKKVADTTGSGAVTSYTYDPLNRLVLQTDPHDFSVGYRYDAAGNLDRITCPGNRTVTYIYDVLNQLKTVIIDWLVGSPTATYVYDATGRLTQLVNFNGTLPGCRWQYHINELFIKRFC